MSNPFSVAAVATFPKGPAQGTDNVTSLPNNQAKAMGSVGTTVVEFAEDKIAPVHIKTGTGTSGSGTLELHFVTGEDATAANWTYGVDPDSTSDQASKLNSNTLIEAINANADSTTYYFKGFSIQSKFGYISTYWTLVLYNKSGSALSATAGDHYAKHSLNSFA